MNNIIMNEWFLVGLTLLCCYLLNSKIKLFALKFSNWSVKDNAVRYVFVVLSIVFIIVLQFAAIPLVILAAPASSIDVASIGVAGFGPIGSKPQRKNQ